MFNIVSTEAGSTITLFEDGQMFIADQSHVNYRAIVAAVTAGEPAGHLFDVAKFVEQKFTKLSDRVSVKGDTVYFDNDPVKSTLADQILDFLSADLDVSPLLKFWEKIAANPLEHSREQLFNWLDASAFTIDTDGDIVAYKGVSGTGPFTSINHGTAIVNGVVHEGAIPQDIGDIVEMPRSEVQHDPNTGCSTGLHAGTFGYATNFGYGKVLTVKINPADVVSVPTDCDAAKMRVCRYKVVGVTDAELELLYDSDLDEVGDITATLELMYDSDLGYKVDDWVETTNHAGTIIAITNHPSSDKYYSVQLDSGKWISLPVDEISLDARPI